jgi:signal transduction histidine kinase
MSSKTDKPIVRSAAWRISFWATLAFAFGTMLVFLFLHYFVADDIQGRSDAWLSGEVQVLADVAERTPKGALHGQVVEEIAELAGKEVPRKLSPESNPEDSVFFLQTTDAGAMMLWVGGISGEETSKAIRAKSFAPVHPFDLAVSGIAVPYRVVWTRIDDGSRIYLGLSEQEQLRVLRILRIRFFFLWMLIVLLGFTVVFVSTRRMLNDVREITEAASRIGHSELNTRVPATERNDEVAQLAFTLNHMLDRIESSMHQLHTITNSLAHDLRSPLTAIRGKLEVWLSAANHSRQNEPIVSAIEELDRLSEFLNQSLDIAEARADALLLTRSEIDLDESLRAMIGLYEPSMIEKGLQIKLRSPGPVKVDADAGLIHRMISNLFDNELKHLPATSTVTIQLQATNGNALLTLEDDGPGFAPEVSSQMFERRVKGRQSKGHGLGLAFVDAVIRAHGGTVTAANRQGGGARISVTLPLASHQYATAANAR